MGSMGKKFAVIVGASALALAACSSDSDDSSGGGSGGDTVASQHDLSGVDLAIGSALDVFGGALPYDDVVAWCRARGM